LARKLVKFCGALPLCVVLATVVLVVGCKKDAADVRAAPWMARTAVKPENLAARPASGEFQSGFLALVNRVGRAAKPSNGHIASPIRAHRVHRCNRASRHSFQTQQRSLR